MKKLIALIALFLSLGVSAKPLPDRSEVLDVKTYQSDRGSVVLLTLKPTSPSCPKYALIVDAEFTLELAKVLDEVTTKYNISVCHDKTTGRVIDRDTLYINSPGGIMALGIVFGKWVKQGGIEVSVPEGAQCASACTFVFLAGHSRYMHKDSRIGFHAPYTDNGGQVACASELDARPMLEGYIEYTNKRLGTYLYREAMRKCGPRAMAWLTEPRARELGLIF